MQVSDQLVAPGHGGTSDASHPNATATERTVGDLVAEVLAIDADAIGADDDLFDDLGADSLLVAELCTRLRSTPGIPAMSIKEVYQHSTIGALAEHIDLSTIQTAEGETVDGVDAMPGALGTPIDDRPVSGLGYWLCGALQLITLAALAAVTALIVDVAFDLVAPASGAWETYWRAVGVGAAVFGLLAILPIVAKWLLIGRWKPGRIRLWSLGYYRFWLGRLAVRSNPLVFFAGTPIFHLYLRALGARVGRGAVVLSRRVPVCTDLISIGDGAVVREEVLVSGYRASGRHLELGPVDIGDGAFVGNGTVLDIHSRVGHSAQVGHSSAVLPGQRVPDGARVEGTPATSAIDVDFVDVAPTARSTPRRIGYGLFQAVLLFFVTTPVITSLAIWFLEWRSSVEPAGTVVGALGVDIEPWRVLIVASIVFGGLIALRMLLAFGVARVLARMVRADTAHPLFGIRYLAHRGVQRLTNQPFFGRYVGDSSFVLPYLRALGYTVSFDDPTGADFGQTVRHDNPHLVTVGSGTMSADGLTLLNADYSNTSFRLSRLEVPSRSFLGNEVLVPTQARIGDNCLLASKLTVPVDGERREDVGLLGSPSFEIPRLVFRDRGFEERRRSPDFPLVLSAKNRHNLRSMVALLVFQFVGFVGAIAVAFGIADVFADLGGVAVFVGAVGVSIISLLYLIAGEWASLRFRRMHTLHCSIYDPRSWRVERFWKFSWQPRLLYGTTLRGPIWRLYGARVGKRLFDDGCAITEKTMVTIGDDCSLNAAGVIQAHSQEDGSFKSGPIEIGSGCTVGVRSLVHYGSTMGDGTTLEANAFLLKGTTTAAGTRWGDNPARELAPVRPNPAPVPEPSALSDGPAPFLDDSTTTPPATPPLERQDRTMTMHLDAPASTNGTDAGHAASTTAAHTANAEAERYWRDALLAGGTTPIPRWTSDDTDAGLGTVAETNVLLTDDLVATLDAIAADHGIGLGPLLLAAHARVIASLTGEDDVVVGYRPRSGERPLPCRLTVSNGTWRELIAESAERDSQLDRFGDVDVAAMRAELNLSGPAFESAVDAGDDTPTDPSTDLPMSIALQRGVAGACLVVSHRLSDFDTQTALRVAGYHLRALEHLAGGAAEPVRSRSIVSAVETDHQIRELSGPARDLPELRFHQLFEAAVADHPDRIAAQHLDERWTYAELNARANRIGHALIDAGVGRETVVAVVTERNLDWMASVLAVFKVGGVYLPIEPHFPAGRIEKTLTRAGCTIALTEHGSTGSLDEALDSIGGVTRLLLDDLTGRGDTSDPGIDVDVDQLAYIYFTSGSTGEPKGAMCEHAGMLNHLYAKIDDFEIRDGEVVAQIAPQCFDISLWQLISALLVGGSTVIVDQDTIMQPERFIDRIVDSGVGVMQVVPSYLEVLLGYLDQHERTLGDVHCVSVTGEALTLELAQRWFRTQTGIKLANAYGLTETSDDTNHEVMREAPVGSVPLGPAVNNAVVYVLDEHLSPVPLGAPGEIAFSGVCVGRGYINDPERTAAAYLDDPLRPGERLYRSGDFGRWRPDGKLEYLGRRDAQVKIRGFRIEIGEIENALSEIDGVRRAAVVIAERDDGNKQLVAFYSGTKHTDAALRDGVAVSLPEYMVPSAFHWRDELPLTDNGKIDRKALRADAEQVVVDTGVFEAPRTETEDRLARHWSDILGIPVEQIGRRDHFFDRGGSSLSAVELVVALDNAVSLKEVTGAPVLADLARVLDGELITDGGLLQRLSEPGSDLATLVCLPYAGGNAVNFQSLARALRGTGVDVYAVELPGHQLTEGDEEFASIDDAAQRIAAEIRDLGGQADRPMMLWGHSAGSALAIEVARRLRGTSGLHSVVVAAQLPGDADARRAHLDHLCSTSDRKLVASMSANTGYGDLDALDAAQIGHLGAALRHDVVGAHRYVIEQLEADPDPIEVPLVVVAADDDTATPDVGARHVEWAHFATTIEYRRIDSGGHFFIRTEPERAAAVVREVLLGEDPTPAENAAARRPASRRASRSALARPLEIETPHDAVARTLIDGDPDPVAFAARHRDTLRGQLIRHGALLVRGLTFDDPDDVLAVAQIVSNGLLDDTEAFAPRERHVGHAFSSSAWPANQQMCLHHELSYRFTFPGLMVFACVQPADDGGAISLASANRMLDELPADLVRRVEEHGWILDRNYTDEIGLSFEAAFGTADREAIDTYCAENSIDAEWTGDGGLRTSQRRRAVVEHPVTGARSWFNQIAFLNEWTLKPDVRDLLVDMYGADGLPFTTRLGDGDPIDADVVATINAAYDACTIREPLRRHDLLLVDNIATAHGRDPYDGEREMVVTLGDPWNADVRMPTNRRTRRKAGASRR